MLVYPFTAQAARPTPHESEQKPASITGRDSYIVAQALFRYIVTEQQKPDDECAWSDLQDTIAVFNAAVGVENAGFFAHRYPDGRSVWSTKRHRGITPNRPTARAPKRACAVFRPTIESTPMTQIITPEERLAEDRGVHALIVGPYGIGKTSLLRTLDPSSTLFVNTEDGDLRP
jgi:hypothetical protein